MVPSLGLFTTHIDFFYTFYKSVRLLHDAAIHSFIIIGEYAKQEHDGLDFIFPDK